MRFLKLRLQSSRRTRITVLIFALPLVFLLHRAAHPPWPSALLRSEKPPSATELSAALSRLARSCRAHAKLSEYGRSQRGRPLHVLHLRATSTSPQSSPVALVTAGLHGREQQAPLAVLLAAEALCRSPEPLGSTILHVAPLTNPDGYERARTMSKVWRKTDPPATTSAPACTVPRAPGVDLNRNFPVGWTSGSDPCAATFGGAHALSESESIALATLVRQLHGRLRAHLDVHSFGALLFRGTALGVGGKRAVLARQRSIARAVRVGVRARSGVDYEDWSASVDPVSKLNRSIGGTFMDFVTAGDVPGVVMELGPRWTMQNRAIGFFEGRNMTAQRGKEVEAAISALLSAANGSIVEYADEFVGTTNP